MSPYSKLFPGKPAVGLPALNAGKPSIVPPAPWYVYSALIFQANDHMDLIANLWDYVALKTPGTENQLKKARKLREALLKASVLVGFPKVGTCIHFMTRSKPEYGPAQCLHT